jgi:CBS domain containing-hemolysin-like protein
MIASKVTLKYACVRVHVCVERIDVSKCAHVCIKWVLVWMYTTTLLLRHLKKKLDTLSRPFRSRRKRWLLQLEEEEEEKEEEEEEEEKEEEEEFIHNLNCEEEEEEEEEEVF